MKTTIYEFKKLPTSEPDESSEEESKSFSPNKSLLNGNYELNNKILFIIYIIIFFTIIFFWIKYELFPILDEKGIIDLKKKKFSIIINIFEKDSNLTDLINNLFSQSISSYEIIITRNCPVNFNDLPLENLKQKKVKFKFIEYSEKDSNLKIKIDSVSRANGEYILFLNPKDHLYNNMLEKFYNITIKDNIDFGQFALFHNRRNLKINEIIYQPQIFDDMFFLKDVFSQTQYHLNGKIIKKKFFLDSIKDLDNYYITKNNKFFDETFIIFFLFKKANSFRILPIYELRDNFESCANYLLFKMFYNKEELTDILWYLKFLMEYTDNKVQEKRMAVQFFIEIIVKKSDLINVYGENEVNLLKEVVELYLKCDLINEYDINLLKSYMQDVLAKRVNNQKSDVKMIL